MDLIEHNVGVVTQGLAPLKLLDVLSLQCVFNLCFCKFGFGGGCADGVG